MKRMVENSEKIEKLLDSVYVSDNDEIYFRKKAILDYGFYSGDDSQFDGNLEVNDELITSNITNQAGEKIVLINQDRYNLTASANIELQAINFGTGIFVHGGIDVGKENGEYEIMTVDYHNMPTGFNFVQITGEPVCSIIIDTNMITKTHTVKINLNKTASEFPVATRYQFSFIIGALSKELWEDY